MITKMQLLLLSLAIILNSCGKSSSVEEVIPITDDFITVNTNQIINDSYIGNGAQWDAYPNAYIHWGQSISDSDWQKMFKRLDFMKPQLMRVVIAAGWKYAAGGGYDPEKYSEGLDKILQYCTDNNITVMFGDWGGGMVDSNQFTIDESKLRDAAKYVDYLINTKGFTCIKYYNLVNEPNGDWSSTNGDYDLWKKAVNFFYTELETLNLTSKLSMVGPDIAIWGTDLTSWVSNSAVDMDDKIGLYDIHTYPGQKTVRDGDYSQIIKAYIDKVPAGKKMVMGELGFKYDSARDKDLFDEDIKRKQADPYASNEDGNMFVKDFFYGIDMADATMQVVNAGYSGLVVWMLDDAMHNTRGDSGKDLKTWGFWNILGEELFGGAKEEEIRPWFYTSSLLSRYMQTGAKVLTVDVPNKRGLKAIAVEKDGKYMIAVLNSGYPSYDVSLKLDNQGLTNVKKFIYSDELRPTDSDGLPVAQEENIDIPAEGLSFEIEGQSLLLFTNMDY